MPHEMLSKQSAAADGLTSQTNPGRCRCHSLKTTDIATAANDLLTIYLDVTNVTCTTVRSAIQLSFTYDAATDPRAYFHKKKVFNATTKSRPLLTKRHRIHFVIDVDRTGEICREVLSNGIAIPPGHDRRRHRVTGLELYRTRYPHSYCPQQLAR